MTAEAEIQPEAWRWENPPPYRADALARTLEINDRGTLEIYDRLDPFRYEQDEEYRLELARHYLRWEKICRCSGASEATRNLDYQDFAKLYRQDPQRWAELVDSMPARYGGEDAARAATRYLADAVRRARSTYEWVYKDVVEAEQRGLSLAELECDRLFRGCAAPVQLDNGAFVAFKESAAASTGAPGAARRLGQLVIRALHRLVF